MDPEHEFSSARAPGPEDDELREMLEAAERRNEAALRQAGRKTTVLIAVPLLAALAWAAVFLVQYRSEVVAADPVPAPPTREQVAQQEDMAAFDSFRPRSQRVGEPATPPPSGGRMIDKGDIEFARDLLDFVQPGASKIPRNTDLPPGFVKLGAWQRGYVA